MIHEDRQFDLVFVGDGSVGLQFIEVVITLGERVFSLILAIVLAYYGGAVGGEKFGDAVKIDPDLSGVVFGVFIKDQLHPQVEVRCVDVVGVLPQAVAGLPGVSDDVSSGDGGSDVRDPMQRARLSAGGRSNNSADYRSCGSRCASHHTDSTRGLLQCRFLRRSQDFPRRS